MQGTWSVGIHFKVPFIDKVAKKVLLKEQVVDFAPQPVITKDNVTMTISPKKLQYPNRIFLVFTTPVVIIRYFPYQRTKQKPPSAFGITVFGYVGGADGCFPDCFVPAFVFYAACSDAQIQREAPENKCRLLALSA